MKKLTLSYATINIDSNLPSARSVSQLRSANSTAMHQQMPLVHLQANVQIHTKSVNASAVPPEETSKHFAII